MPWPRATCKSLSEGSGFGRSEAIFRTVSDMCSQKKGKGKSSNFARKRTHVPPVLGRVGTPGMGGEVGSVGPPVVEAGGGAPVLDGLGLHGPAEARASRPATTKDLESIVTEGRRRTKKGSRREKRKGIRENVGNKGSGDIL